jgi:hypothetical protein
MKYVGSVDERVHRRERKSLPEKLEHPCRWEPHRFFYHTSLGQAQSVWGFSGAKVKGLNRALDREEGKGAHEVVDVVAHARQGAKEILDIYGRVHSDSRLNEVLLPER